jgi:CO dehydrogenase/acetyl-CoA synthase beta subunit
VQEESDMSVFDEYIDKVSEYLENIRRDGRQIREFPCPSSVDELKEGLPVQVGPGVNPGIILRSDTFTELGNPAVGSSSLLMWTDNPSLVNDGKITLIGPDIPESDGASLLFGQVLMIGVKGVHDEIQERIEEYQHISDHLEGYMVRTSSQNVWGRVSKDAAGKGFTLETLGRALMVTMKSNVPEVEAMEVVFVTSSKEDIKQLDEIAAQVSDIRKDLIKEIWKARGYDLDCDFDCGSCMDQSTCDEIRKVIAARKKKTKGL